MLHSVIAFASRLAWSSEAPCWESLSWAGIDPRSSRIRLELASYTARVADILKRFNQSWFKKKTFFRKNGYCIPAKPEQSKSCIILPVWYWPTWQRSTITWDEILNSTIFFSFSSLPEQPIKISFHHLCCSGIESVEVSSVLRLQAFRCETVDAPEKHQTIVNFTSTWELLL